MGSYNKLLINKYAQATKQDLSQAEVDLLKLFSKPRSTLHSLVSGCIASSDFEGCINDILAESTKLNFTQLQSKLTSAENNLLFTSNEYNNVVEQFKSLQQTIELARVAQTPDEIMEQSVTTLHKSENLLNDLFDLFKSNVDLDQIQNLIDKYPEYNNLLTAILDFETSVKQNSIMNPSVAELQSLEIETKGIQQNIGEITNRLKIAIDRRAHGIKNDLAEPLLQQLDAQVADLKQLHDKLQAKLSLAQTKYNNLKTKYYKDTNILAEKSNERYTSLKNQYDAMVDKVHSYLETINEKDNQLKGIQNNLESMSNATVNNPVWFDRFITEHNKFISVMSKFNEAAINSNLARYQNILNRQQQNGPDPETNDELLNAQHEMYQNIIQDRVDASDQIVSKEAELKKYKEQCVQTAALLEQKQNNLLNTPKNVDDLKQAVQDSLYNNLSIKEIADNYVRLNTNRNKILDNLNTMIHIYYAALQTCIEITYIAKNLDDDTKSAILDKLDTFSELIITNDFAPVVPLGRELLTLHPDAKSLEDLIDPPYRTEIARQSKSILVPNKVTKVNLFQQNVSFGFKNAEMIKTKHDSSNMMEAIESVATNTDTANINANPSSIEKFTPNIDVVTIDDENSKPIIPKEKTKTRKYIIDPPANYLNFNSSDVAELDNYRKQAMAEIDSKLKSSRKTLNRIKSEIADLKQFISNRNKEYASIKRPTNETKATMKTKQDRLDYLSGVSASMQQVIDTYEQQKLILENGMGTDELNANNIDEN